MVKSKKLDDGWSSGKNISKPWLVWRNSAGIAQLRWDNGRLFPWTGQGSTSYSDTWHSNCKLSRSRHPGLCNIWKFKFVPNNCRKQNLCDKLLGKWDGQLVQDLRPSHSRFHWDCCEGSHTLVGKLGKLATSRNPPHSHNIPLVNCTLWPSLLLMFVHHTKSYVTYVHHNGWAFTLLPVLNGSFALKDIVYMFLILERFPTKQIPTP